MTEMLTMIRSMGSRLGWAAELAVPEIAPHQDFVKMHAVNAGLEAVPVGTIEKLKKLLVEDEG